MERIQEFDVVEATYRPRQVESLGPELRKWFGKRLTLLATRVVTEGQMVFAPYPLTAAVPFVLLPGSDLAAVAVVRRFEQGKALSLAHDSPGQATGRASSEDFG
jgi:hypothetical protein